MQCILGKLQKEEDPTLSSLSDQHVPISECLRQEIDYSLNTFIETIKGPYNYRSEKNFKFNLVMTFLLMKKNGLKEL